ncbi:MAG: formylglycine-generating enzyme family protein [Steroidobacteraceae bacterium]
MPASSTAPMLRAGLALVLLALAPLCAPTAAHAGENARAGRVFKDCRDCPEMVVVPPGEFRMGREGGETDRYEGPEHMVRIPRAFAAGRFELTNGQYRDFVRATGHPTAGTGCNAFFGNSVKALEGTSWADPGYGRPIRDDEPVVCIRWSDAQAYVNWLAGRTGKKYRLLTEAEWEYAARAGTQGLYTWGEDPAAACRWANVHDVSGSKAAPELPYPPPPCDDGYAGVAPVGKFPPNAFGLYDMIGNVWEWVEDCYQMPFGATPVDGSAQLAVGCDRRGSRGGSWRTVIERQRPAFRGRDPESLTSQIFGMRVARTLD